VNAKEGHPWFPSLDLLSFGLTRVRFNP